MNKQTKIIVATVLLGIAVYATIRILSERNATPVHIIDGDAEKDWTLLGTPMFEWKYVSFEKDFIPHTVVSLNAIYTNGTIRTKEIDTIEGGCNEYASPENDVYIKSTEIICYYSGLGRYYKVVLEGEEYIVKRKVFEEASPDYNPPIQGFITIEKF